MLAIQPVDIRLILAECWASRNSFALTLIRGFPIQDCLCNGPFGKYYLRHPAGVRHLKELYGPVEKHRCVSRGHTIVDTLGSFCRANPLRSHPLSRQPV